MVARTKEAQRGSKISQKPESLRIADKGIRTGTDFANLMSCLMSDLISGKVTPQVGNAVCNAGSQLLKIEEMKRKYGSTITPQSKQPDLTLSDGA